MIYNGWAFSPDEDQKYEANRNAYSELCKENKLKCLWVKHEYGSNRYLIQATKAFTPNEMLLWADNGNLCFGGLFEAANDPEKVIPPGTYKCKIYID